MNLEPIIQNEVNQKEKDFIDFLYMRRYKYLCLFKCFLKYIHNPMRACFSKTQIDVPCFVCLFSPEFLSGCTVGRWLISNDLTFLEPKSEQLFLFCIRLLNKSRRNTCKMWSIICFNIESAMCKGVLGWSGLLYKPVFYLLSLLSLRYIILRCINWDMNAHDMFGYDLIKTIFMQK